MIPADTDDVRRDYEVLLGELTQYNPELLDKRRLLAVTKCDMLDEELIGQMRDQLPEGVLHLVGDGAQHRTPQGHAVGCVAGVARSAPKKSAS